MSMHELLMRTKDLRSKLFTLATMTRHAISRLDFAISKIEMRKKVLEKRLSTVQGVEAKIISKELEAMDRIQRRLRALKVVLESIMLRAETASIAGPIMSTVAMIYELLKELKGRGIILPPEYLSIVDELFAVTRDLLSRASVLTGIEEYDIICVRNEARKILEEAEDVAAERLHKQLSNSP